MLGTAGKNANICFTWITIILLQIIYINGTRGRTLDEENRSPVRRGILLEQFPGHYLKYSMEK